MVETSVKETGVKETGVKETGVKRKTYKFSTQLATCAATHPTQHNTSLLPCITPAQSLPH
jgi:hypothetical protein